MIFTPQGRRRRETRRGSAIIEFALVGSFIFLPLLAGLATVGVSLVTAMQVSNVNANAGQMFSAGVDFTQAANVNLISKIGGNLNITSSGGNGEVILSEIDVAADGSGNITCSNQVILGNAGQGSSRYAPAPPMVLSAFTSQLMQNQTLAAGEKFYLAETFYNNPQLAWTLAPAHTGTGIYMVTIF